MSRPDCFMLARRVRIAAHNGTTDEYVTLPDDFNGVYCGTSPTGRYKIVWW